MQKDKIGVDGSRLHSFNTFKGLIQKQSPTRKNRRLAKSKPAVMKPDPTQESFLLEESFIE